MITTGDELIAEFQKLDEYLAKTTLMVKPPKIVKPNQKIHDINVKFENGKLILLGQIFIYYPERTPVLIESTQFFKFKEPLNSNWNNNHEWMKVVRRFIPSASDGDFNYKLADEFYKNLPHDQLDRLQGELNTLIKEFENSAQQWFDKLSSVADQQLRNQFKVRFVPILNKNSWLLSLEPSLILKLVQASNTSRTYLQNIVTTSVRCLNDSKPQHVRSYTDKFIHTLLADVPPEAIPTLMKFRIPSLNDLVFRMNNFLGQMQQEPTAQFSMDEVFELISLFRKDDSLDINNLNQALAPYQYACTAATLDEITECLNLAVVKYTLDQ